ncbi:Metallophosphoesterase 1 [Homalodisca vitripennis]|nr:Metallophosphoesterase 1 [Homalodisca vitripennis]
MKCHWPSLDTINEEPNIAVGDGGEVKVMLLADTHLLGSRRGHWFDKLRREWQMHRAFQTAITLHRPDIVFVLGDVFDEGLSCSDAEFNAYVQRFHSLFRVPTGTQIFVVVGNHDIGFHYGISPYLQERFTQAFNAPSVRLLSIAGNHFVLINSMAMEGDGCFLCRPAELQTEARSKRVNPLRIVLFWRAGTSGHELIYGQLPHEHGAPHRIARYCILENSAVKVFVQMEHGPAGVCSQKIKKIFKADFRRRRGLSCLHESELKMKSSPSVHLDAGTGALAGRGAFSFGFSGFIGQTRRTSPADDTHGDPIESQHNQ